MEWAHYFRNVVSRLRVIIEGWLEDIPFANLSTVSSSMPQLKLLQRKWEMGETHWKEISEDQLEELRWKRDEQLKNGEIVERARRTRSDKGKKRTRDRSASGRRKKHKTNEIIEDKEEEGEDEDSHTDATGVNATSAQANTGADTATGTNTGPAQPPIADLNGISAQAATGANTSATSVDSIDSAAESSVISPATANAISVPISTGADTDTQTAATSTGSNFWDDLDDIFDIGSGSLY